MTQPRKTAHEMFPLVEVYLAGSSTQKDFCEEHRLSRPVLNYWIAKYRRNEVSGDGSGFVELRSNRTPTEQPFLEVVYPRGVRLRLFAPVTPGYLELLLASAQ